MEGKIPGSAVLVVGLVSLFVALETRSRVLRWASWGIAVVLLGTLF